MMWLSRRDVLAICARIDPLQVVADALHAQSEGRVTIPEESYLGWRTAEDDAARCLAMPGAIQEPGGLRAGVKIIGSSLGNTSRGLPRAHGLLVLLDPE